MSDTDPVAAATEAALPHDKGAPFAVVIVKPIKRPHELAAGVVARLEAGEAGALVRSGRARAATPDDIAIAGVHFRDLA